MKQQNTANAGCRRARHGWMTALGFAVAIGWTTSVAAQETSERPQVTTISGNVVHAQTGQPVRGAEIHVTGTTRSTVSGARGEFRIANLRPGAYQVTARALGYRTGMLAADVTTAGSVATLNFQLSGDVIPLDQVVVTGQASAGTRREIGHTVVSIDAEALKNAPVTSVSQLLQARAPGVNVLSSGGKAGQGSRVLMRGVGSLAQDFRPIIYVDGVRIDNDVQTGLNFGGASWSGLDDLNIHDIDRVEIVKGASASALYGTEAAAGVIQVFTKQGKGPARVDFRSDVGVSQTPRAWWGNTQGADWFHENVVRTGLQHREHGSINGSVDRFTYFTSGTFTREDGVLPASNVNTYAFRSNMRIAPRQNFEIGGTIGYGRRDVQFPLDGSHPFALTRHGLLGGATGASGSPTDTVETARIDEAEIFLNSARFTAGVTLDFLPKSWFTHHLVIGGDVMNTDNTLYHEYGSVVDFEGSKANTRRQALTLNVDYIGKLGWQVSPAVHANTAFGVQGYTVEESLIASYGNRFAGPGISDGSQTGVNNSSEVRIERKQIGFFAEEQFGYRDYAFLTLGARVDGHSAFGDNEEWQVYPRASGSYVLSHHDFLPSAVGTLRVRAAYGIAGQQPADFAALRFWRSFASAGSAGISTGNIGNPNLAPEKSHEMEAGFDAGLFNDRVDVEFTFYNRRTTGALVPVQYAPSVGWPLPLFENRGEIKNSGIEIAAGATLIDRPTLNWHVHSSLFTNKNRIESIGGLDPINLVGAQWHEVGSSVAGFFADREEMVDGVLERVRGEYIGPAFPTRSIQLGTNVSVKNLSLALLAEHRGGHYLESNTLRREAELADPTSTRNRADFIYSADFWRLREVSLAYDLPASLLQRIRMGGATLTISGRNLFRSQDYNGLEAEANYDAFQPFGAQTFFDTPLPRQTFVGLRLNF